MCSGFRQFRQNVPGAEVVNGVNRVQPQRIAVAGLEPVADILDHVFAHAGAVRAVVIDGVAPRGAVVVGKVGSQSPEIIAFRAEVVVDHIDDNRQTFTMAGVHQPLEARDATVGMLYGVRINAVVTPVALAGELGDRHQLQGVHPQFAQFRQTRDDRVESAFRGKGSDMQLVHHPLRER